MRLDSVAALIAYLDLFPMRVSRTAHGTQKNLIKSPVCVLIGFCHFWVLRNRELTTSDSGEMCCVLRVKHALGKGPNKQY